MFAFSISPGHARSQLELSLQTREPQAAPSLCLIDPSIRTPLPSPEPLPFFNAHECGEMKKEEPDREDDHRSLLASSVRGQMLEVKHLSSQAGLKRCLHSSARR